MVLSLDVVLKRNLRFWDVFCMAAGAMISSGLFVLPSVAYREAGGYLVTSYLLAGILMIPSIWSQAELSSAMPKAGGAYFFIERSFGSFFGIFSGLANWFSIAAKSAFALVGIGAFIEYLSKDITYPQIKAVAVGFCVIFIILNLISTKDVALLQKYLVGFLFLALSAYIVAGIVYLMHGMEAGMLTGGGIPMKSVSPLRAVLSTCGMVFISYGGITKIASIAEDTETPHKVIPMGMFAAFLAVQITYIATIYITLYLLPKAELINTLTPITHGAFRLAGPFFAALMSFAALAAFITTANAGLLSASRVPLGMAEDKLLPGFFSNISPRFHTPRSAVIVTGMFMIFAITFLELKSLVKVASTLMIILFVLINMALIIMRESRIINYRPVFRSPFYPVPQILAILAYGILILEMGIVAVSISAGFIIISLFVYYFFVKLNLRRQSAIVHLVTRITSKELVSTALEEELKEIIQKRDNVIKDRFDRLIESCPVINLKDKITFRDFFSMVSGVLSENLELTPAYIEKLLLKREEESTTVIDKGLAVPHIVVEGENKFEIVVVKAEKGIMFPNQLVRLAFVLAGSRDERNFHLRALMAIAQIVREHNFYANLLRAKNESHLRVLILSSTRKRD